jgi:hypothetical protein
VQSRTATQGHLPTSTRSSGGWPTLLCSSGSSYSSCVRSRCCGFLPPTHRNEAGHLQQLCLEAMGVCVCELCSISLPFLPQDPEPGRLQSENAQLTDTVVQQRQLITELRSQLQHNGTQAPPEQVQIGDAA